METVETAVPRGDEGSSPAAPGAATYDAVTPSSGVAPGTVATPNQEVVGDQVQEPTGTGEAQPEVQGPITPQQLRKLRGQYFTVRHIPLVECGHKMDVINEPRHRNCENCWWNFFLYHPDLVKAVDEAWYKEGRAFVVRMRGTHFSKMFGRFQKTVQYFKEQEENEKRKTTTGGETRETASIEPPTSA